MKKLGKYAAYTAPALLALMTKPAKAVPVSLPCDRRLKRDISEVGILPNGLKMYAFRYWNDDRTFASVMAQDLLEDERFRHAVIEDESGYYMVNLGALGLDVTGSRSQFFEAGQKAVAEAAPVSN